VEEPAPLLTAVLVALAGVRQGQDVAVVGPGRVLRQALAAGTGRELVEDGPADVVVVVLTPDVPGGVSRLRPGGRLVAVAADDGAVTRTAARQGLVAGHREAVNGRVAWSARLPS
jgi:hypothetical protein